MALLLLPDGTQRGIHPANGHDFSLQECYELVGSPEEQQIPDEGGVVDTLHRSFAITSVSRADLLSVGYTKEQVLAISDEQMDELARKMGDDYCNQLFWNSLEILAEFVTGMKPESAPADDDDEDEDDKNDKDEEEEEE